MSFERPARRRRLRRTSVRELVEGALCLFADLENYTVSNVTGIGKRLERPFTLQKSETLWRDEGGIRSRCKVVTLISSIGDGRQAVS